VKLASSRENAFVLKAIRDMDYTSVMLAFEIGDFSNRTIYREM